MDKRLSRPAKAITSTKTIIFKSDEKQHCFETNSNDVIVIGSTGNHDHGSSKVKLKNIVDYKWETKNYPGRLIAIHLDGKHIAYAIKVNNRGTVEGMVRVVHSVYSQRALIKGMSNEVLDLQFAHLQCQVILGCIEEAALHIHKIDSEQDKIITTLLLKIEDPFLGHVPKYDKISWCPSVPQSKDDIDEYASQLLVWVRGSCFQCYSVNTIIGVYGIGTHSASDIKEGSIKYKENTRVITGAVFSPDGTTLAVSSEDGYIDFYQIYLHIKDANPRRLHQWKPHDGKSVSSFFFLDNYEEYSPNNTFWKHAITGAENNTEIKVWRCDTWTCTQTINFQSNAEYSQPLFFKAEIDRTSSYLMLSEMNNRVLYALQIEKFTTNEDGSLKFLMDNVNKNGQHGTTGEDGNSSKNQENDDSKVTSLAYVKSISEFPLSSPILSFGIVDAAARRYKCALTDAYLIDELDDYDEENNSLFCVVIHMFLVQPKSVQECHVLYQPSLNPNLQITNTLSDESESESYKNDLISINNSLDRITKNAEVLNDHGKLNLTTSASSPSSHTLDYSTSISPNQSGLQLTNNATQKHSSQINLMTPDSFNSPGKKTPDNVSEKVMSTIRMLAASTTSPDQKKKSLESINILNLVNNKSLEEQEQQKRTSAELQRPLLSDLPVPPCPPVDLLTSGGSSPSREVEKILSLKDEDCINEFFDDTDNLILDENDGLVEDIGITDDLLENSNSLAAALEHNEDYDTQPVKEIEYGNKEDELDIKKSNDWPQVPKVPIITRITPDVHIKSNKVENINFKLDQILEVVQNQKYQIDQLQKQVAELQEIKTDENVKLTSFANKIEANLSKLIEEYLIRYERQHNLKLDNFIGMRDKQIRELRDSLVQTITQLFFNQLTEKLSSIFIGELQRHTLPIIVGKLDAIKQQIQIDIAQKLTSSDQLLRENISQVCTSKSIVEAFGNSVLRGVQNGLQTTYIETLTNTLIPAYEKSSQELFRQLNDAFMQGAKNYTRQFEIYMDQFQPLQDRSDELLGLIQTLPDHFKASNDKIINSCTAQIMHDMNKDFKSLQANLLKALKDNIKNEIQRGFETQTANLEDSVLSVVRSQAQTPSIFDVQEQIKQLLNQGQINKAFHQALLANDLSLVEFTLEKADYKSVFNPCPLEQTVLLSLIQQISAYMITHNDLKQKYLSDAIINLNLHDPITKEHAPKVMRELYQNCQSYISTNPNSHLSSSVKMLLMAVQGLGFKLF